MRPWFLAGIVIMTGFAKASAEQVQIIRDRWGIAHVYAASEESLFFGVGYASAEDRLLQMTLRRREVQGRLAEIFGPGKKDKFIKSDRFYRTLGLMRQAGDEFQILDEDEQRILNAYAEGINAYLKENLGSLSPLFEQYGGEPEPWAPADSIALWNRFVVKFSPGWQKEVLAKRELEKSPDKFRKDLARDNQRAAPDEPAAIVSREEFKRSNPEIYKRLMKLAAEMEPVDFFDVPDSDDHPKMSHNWVVAGARSTTGKPILEVDPQLAVQNPNTGYEIHLAGGRYNVRGMTMAGMPGMLVGFNERCAWGASALSSDAADLFEEKVNPDNTDQYRWKDEWREFERQAETIRVKGGDPVTFEVRSTLHGPVVNDLLKGVKPGEVYALTLTIYDPSSSSIGSLLKIMRATDWDSFRAGASGYHGIGAHMIYADVDGNIGYQSMVKTPRRRCGEPRLPRKGWTGEDEWEMLPFEMLPSMLNPKQNYIATANGLPVDSWYPYAVSAGLGGGPRTDRLRELFAGDGKFSPQDFLTKVHQDSVTTVVRDFALLVRAAIQEDGAPNEEMRQAADTLEKWDGRMRTDSLGFPLAYNILAIIQKQAKGDWIMGYGGQWAGMTALFRELMDEHRETGRAPADPNHRKWLIETLQAALASPAAEKAGFDEAGFVHHMPYQSNFGFGSLAPEYDQVSPPLKCKVPHALWSQGGETYVQIVDLSDLDNSQAMMPPGISENPQSPHFSDQTTYWANGTLRAAPLSRLAVEAIKESVTQLEYPGSIGQE